eukprot:CAMPEP_0197706656 /NCGR_PEP_ID=MMETSP1338-20131121/127054_1 /TAXON_ID=43686 ORGANISM="Pelagodinium beii, Strain RCC1491" /NCGR_SAMPLE_ID=MMETSP1338 /ASSEMBLY_ACC=CAM_ASM_000754 /LENGTH=548 /DNA_ID=CAMNT_0043290569 /DNA_START=63 /DNA_END=1709 /DNA_ORIENTATION=-
MDPVPKQVENNAEAAKNVGLRARDAANLGVMMHFFTEGVIVGSLPGVFTGFLLVYLSLPANIVLTAFGLAKLPVTFSFFLGLVSDCTPIRGRHRQPYMILGWGITSSALLFLAAMSPPAPYFCLGADGAYDMMIPPCNPEARTGYWRFVLGIALIALGLAVSTAGASGLVIEYAKREKDEVRGSGQMTIRIVFMLGTLCSSFLQGFGFNGKLYNGTFDQAYQLSIQSYFVVILLLAVLTFCLCCFRVHELLASEEFELDLESDVKSSDGLTATVSLQEHFRNSWSLLSSKNFFCVAMFFFWETCMAQVKSPALTFVGQTWAGVRTLQSQVANVLGIVMSALAFWAAKKYFLHTDWRKILAVTLVATVVLDAIPQLLTIFNVVRNQYFYLGEHLPEVIPRAAASLVQDLLVVELADETNAGLVCGIILSVSYMADPFAKAVSVQVFSLFGSNLSNVMNFVEDSTAFRGEVALSYLLDMALNLSILLLLPLIPRQRADTQRRKSEWSRHMGYAIATVLLLTLALLYALLVDFAALVPDLACSKFVGGPGC